MKSDDLTIFIDKLREGISTALAKCYRDMSRKAESPNDYYFLAGKTCILNELRDDLRNYEKEVLSVVYGDVEDAD